MKKNKAGLLIVLAVLVFVTTVACAPLNWVLGLFGLEAVPVASETTPTAVPTVRIPGRGSQLDHSGGLLYARIEVHDNENPNEAGYFDRTIINSSNPEEIGLDDSFKLPDGWKAERDFSLKANQFVSYWTVKPHVRVNQEEILRWAEENDLVEMTSYQVTSVVVRDGQECSKPGLDESRVRVNIYVGENWSAQYCPAQ